MIYITRLASVFSAHAEVVPFAKTGTEGFGGILRARGGSSTTRQQVNAVVLYSPRTRR